LKQIEAQTAWFAVQMLIAPAVDELYSKGDLLKSCHLEIVLDWDGESSVSRNIAYIPETPRATAQRARGKLFSGLTNTKESGIH
jgi:hypothetical protein